ncbi:MAG: sigma 54-interacting transcriptional regulator [Proteobacteria bacterium]|nr:sigma 54-interacting transcriptional regulator [Pseudomonadota bacterium]
MLAQGEFQQAALDLFALVSDMAGARDRVQLSLKCLHAACRIAGAEGGVLYALDLTGRHLVPLASLPLDMASAAEHTLPLYPGGQPDMADPRTWCAFTGSMAVIEDVPRVHGFDRTAILRRDARGGRRTGSLIACPLRGNDDITVGVLELVDMRDAAGERLGQDGLRALAPVVRAFAYQAAITISNTALLERNRKLLAELDAANRELHRENTRLKHQTISLASRASGIVTQSPAMERVLDMVGKVAESSVPVLVLGETGTGKEMVARMVHAASPRSNGPFIAQNCAALPADLLESELFGYRKGAFTGATANKKGLFEIAHGGTLFLDEIGDMPAGLQTKLLRVLQDGEVRSLGATEGRRFDVRIVAATNVDLRQRVADGRFREDLFYRISVFPVALPPLRERKGDAVLLAEYLLGQMRDAHAKDIAGITPEAAAALDRYPFPGNVRELRNSIERAVILCPPGAAIGLAELPAEIVNHAAAPPEEPPASPSPPTAPPAAEEEGPDLRDSVRRYEAVAIAEALKAHGGNRTRTALALGLSRRTLLEKIARYGL